MTVENEKYRNDYDGDGSTTSFPVDFYFLADEHLRVILTDSSGVSTDQVLNTDYTVTGAGNQSGGSVEMVTAPASGEQLTILRNVPLTQLYDYLENDNFPADSHETALDKLTMITQQQEEVYDRTFTVEPAYEGTDVETVPLADSFLIWDNDGDELTNMLFSDINNYVEIERLYNSGNVQCEAFNVDGVSGIEISNESGGPSFFIYQLNSNPDFWGMVSNLPGASVIISTRNAVDTDYHTGIDMQPDGKTTLYFNGVEAIETEENGGVIRDTNGAGPQLIFKDDFENIHSRLLAQPTNFYIQMWDGASYDVKLTAVLNGGVALNYGGSDAIITEETGGAIQDPSGSDPTLHFKNDTGTNLGSISFDASGNLDISGIGASTDRFITAELDGGPKFYFDDDEALEITNTGATIKSSTFATGLVLEGGGVATGTFLTNNLLYELYIQIYDSVDLAVEDGIIVRGNSSVGFCYDGEEVARTGTEGFELGEDDIKRGVLSLFGAGTGSVNGGIIGLYTAADYDSVIDEYVISVNEDDFRIGPNTDQDALKYDGGKGWWESNVEFVHSTTSVNMGPPDTDGSWRMTVSGTNWLLQRRESGAWVTKTTIPA